LELNLSSYHCRFVLTILDSSIYFHNPKKVRADEWMFTEMVSPWAGDGRGVVMQKIYSMDGTLLATAIQEVSWPLSTSWSPPPQPG
jgi:acyl-CoA thioesterase II